MYVIGRKYKPEFESFGKVILERHPPIIIHTSSVEKERFFKTFHYEYTEEVYEAGSPRSLKTTLSGRTLSEDTAAHLFEEIQVSPNNFFYAISCCGQSPFRTHERNFILPSVYQVIYNRIVSELA